MQALGELRDVYEKMGGLNEELYPNEENELMSRIQSDGMKLIHDPDIYVLRSQRNGLGAFARQMLNYGRGRAEQTIISPASARLMHFIPALFVIYLISLPIFLSLIYLLPLLCYVLLALMFSLKAALDLNKGFAMKAKMLFIAFPLFSFMHIAYGIGSIYGLNKLLVSSPEKRACEVRVRKSNLLKSK